MLVCVRVWVWAWRRRWFNWMEYLIKTIFTLSQLFIIKFIECVTTWDKIVFRFLRKKNCQTLFMWNEQIIKFSSASWKMLCNFLVSLEPTSILLNNNLLSNEFVWHLLEILAVLFWLKLITIRQRHFCYWEKCHAMFASVFLFKKCKFGISLYWWSPFASKML